MGEEKKVIADVITDDDSDEPKKKSYTPEEYAKVCSEAKTYRKDKAAVKKERDEFEAKFKALEEEKLTELEKERKKNIELEKKLIDNEVNTNQAKTDSLIVEAISDKNIIDKTVFKLLVKSELESEEEINDKVIAKIVDKLIKDKPYLISSTPVNPSDGNFKKQDNTIKKSPKDMLGDFIQGKISKLS